jgi:ABC-type uncharacterized transport system substrate-binding protein
VKFVSAKLIIKLMVSILSFALCISAEAQQEAKLRTIGWLTAGGAFADGRYRQFIRELRNLGYVENKNVVFIYLSADNYLDRLPAPADELVRRSPEVIVTRGTPETVALKKATVSIPIVFYSVTDPVGSGLVSSLARPGSNITGLSSIEAVLAGKRLELLKLVVPQLSHIGILWNPNDLSSAQQWKEMRHQHENWRASAFN